jgi:hypothetical protein
VSKTINLVEKIQHKSKSVKYGLGNTTYMSKMGQIGKIVGKITFKAVDPVWSKIT